MNEQVRKVVVPALVGVAGLSVGGAVGYIVGQRKERRRRVQLVQSREVMTQQAVEAMEEYNKYDFDQPKIIARGESVVLEKLHDITETQRVPYYKVRSPELGEREEPPDPTKIRIDRGDVEATNDTLEMDGNLISLERNIFADSELYVVDDDEWDYEDERELRSDKSIYVIHRDEFDADDLGFRQSTVYWYEGDRMLADENGDAIYNWTSHIGTELPFGHGSGDENVLFVRNENLKWEYNVCRDPGRFDQEVEGHAIELEYEEEDLKHSKQPLKMRRE